MNINKNRNSTIIKSDTYEITIIPEKLLILLRKGDSFYYGMCMLSAVDTTEQFDMSSNTPKIRKRVKDNDMISFDIECDSSIWEKKIHHYNCFEDRIEYWTEVHGSGRIDRAYYFRGTIENNEVASVPGFTRIFSPMPNFIEKQEFHASEHTLIGAGNTKEVLQSIRGFGFHGAPLCFVCHEGDTPPFMAAGILARPGEYMFHAFEVNHMNENVRKAHEPIVGTQAFSLAYYGHQQVDGVWHTPKLSLQFSDDRYSAIEKYIRLLERYGGTVKRTSPYPEWTFKPIYCTWHDQVAIGMKDTQTTNLSFGQMESGKRYFDVLNQKQCEHWLDILWKNNVKPGTFIIDATWQVNVGDNVADKNKFPDLRSFIDKCHDRKIRVILWCKGWDRTGVPDDECCLIDGKPFATDPTNPKYQRRAANFIHRMLSSEEGCYNADGLKLDGISTAPYGPGLKTHGGLAGFELMRALLKLFFNEAKKVEPDCAICQYTAFPYFADLCDCLRTGDLYTVKGDPGSADIFRAKIQRTVMPRIAIDTDGAQRFNYVLPYEEVLEAQNKAGVPCIYQAEWLIQRRDFCIPGIRRLGPEHYQKIQKAWGNYQSRFVGEMKS